MTAKKLSPEEARLQAYQGGYRAFLLLAAFLVGSAGYQYHLWTGFERRVEAARNSPGPSIVLETGVFAGLYERGGTWAVVGLNAGLALVALVAGLSLWRTYRRLLRDHAQAKGPPEEG